MSSEYCSYDRRRCQSNNTSRILELLMKRERHVDATQMLRQRNLDQIATSIPWNTSRMQNMILTVGPGTPASITMASSSSASSSSADSDSSSEEDDEEDDDVLGEVGRNREVERRIAEILDHALHAEEEAQHYGRRGRSNEEENDNDDDEEEEGTDHDNEITSRRRQRQLSESSGESSIETGNVDVSIAFHSATQAIPTSISDIRRLRQSVLSQNTSPTNPNPSTPISTPARPVPNLATPSPSNSRYPFLKRPAVPAMKHGGCINTATWLTCPWRLSSASTADNGGYTMSNGFIHSSSHSSNNEYTRSSPPNPSSSQVTPPSASTRPRSGSTSSGTKFHAIPSRECPTQLITSGDDRLIKFWDVSAAMGSSSPSFAGRSTETPFSSTRSVAGTTNGNKPPFTHPLHHSMEKHVKEWKQTMKHGRDLPGTVVPLTTLLSGHRGNVFHVTPVPGQPGKVATCAADGFLRLSDVELQVIQNTAGHSHLASNRFGGRFSRVGVGQGTTPSQVIISPEYDDEVYQQFGGARGMCFSHCFLNSNVGLLCSERGLRRFDLRLSPMRQQMRHVFWDGDGGSGGNIQAYARRAGVKKTCKACAVWRESEDDEMDSHYVFSGGACGEVALFDLRMDGPSRVVQKYKPTNLRENTRASVSGLDLSRDRRELLVSYENDQIYTFPIFPSAPRSGPTIGHLNHNFNDFDTPLPELASYGGHLNRFTFLKNAKYAGPNDEYICTGSDSGHAWIYERSTGAVAALLKADHSTCNGVIPHPSLPFFVTYGIDSTAKLWRATNPIDDDVDDSSSGRAQTHLNRSYEKSLIVRHWKTAQDTILDLSDFVQKGFSLLPDQIPTRSDPEDSFFGSFASRHLGDNLDGPYIANDSRRIPDVLQRNRFTCTKAAIGGDDEPVLSGIEGFNRRVSLIRLRNQADRLGLKADANVPWVMQPRRKRDPLGKESNDVGDDTINHPSDLVPDFPSDWMQYDLEMTSNPSECGINFNRKKFDEFFRDVYGQFGKIDDDTVQDIEEITDESVVSEESIEQSDGIKVDNLKGVDEVDQSEKDDGTNDNKFHPQNAWKILLDTVLLLKEGGNKALQSGLESLAAHRYDKGIRYCAMAFLVFPHGNLTFLEEHQRELVRNGGFEVHWTPLLKALITIRLNLSLTMLKSSINDRKGAIDQAELALDALRPFTEKKGFVYTGKKLDQPKEEPIQTFTEAKELQAKAYFRLGTAQNANMDFGCAVQSFEKSIQCKQDMDPNSKTEPIVLRRLAEAKRDHVKKKKRHRKKFKSMFTTEVKSDDDDKQGQNT